MTTVVANGSEIYNLCQGTYVVRTTDISNGCTSEDTLVVDFYTLSAIVDLKTWTRFGDFNANTFGITPLSLGYGRGYGNDSTACGINIDYSNIEYFQNFNNSSSFIKSRVDFTSPPEGLEIKTNYAKKFKNGIALEFKDKAKQKSFLQNRGFSFQQIDSVFS